MKLSNKILVAFIAIIFLSLAFSLCAYAMGGERFEPSKTDPSKHDVIIDGQKVGEMYHRASEIDATCFSRAICIDCKAEFGDFAPHDFIDATCTSPKTCRVCDYQEGAPIAHSGGEAKCLALAVCTGCGSEYGEILGHTGGEATCTLQAVCTRCNEPYGKPLAHTGGKADCQNKALCAACNTAYGELGSHIINESWVVEKEFHYQACLVEGCQGAVFNDGDHFDDNEDGRCDTCQHKYKLSKGQSIIMIIGLTVGTISLAGFSIFGIAKSIKKKK